MRRLLINVRLHGTGSAVRTRMPALAIDRRPRANTVGNATYRMSYVRISVAAPQPRSHYRRCSRNASQLGAREIRTSGSPLGPHKYSVVTPGSAAASFPPSNRAYSHLTAQLGKWEEFVWVNGENDAEWASPAATGSTTFVGWLQAYNSVFSQRSAIAPRKRAYRGCLHYHHGAWLSLGGLEGKNTRDKQESHEAPIVTWALWV